MAENPKDHNEEVRVRRILRQAKALKKCSRVELILAMVQLGCAVIPVVPHAKQPAIKNWQNEASKDVNIIKDYFFE